MDHPRPAPARDRRPSQPLLAAPAQQSLRQDSACVPRYAALIPTLLLWQRHILPFHSMVCHCKHHGGLPSPEPVAEHPSSEPND